MLTDIFLSMIGLFLIFLPKGSWCSHVQSFSLCMVPLGTQAIGWWSLLSVGFWGPICLSSCLLIKMWVISIIRLCSPSCHSPNCHKVGANFCDAHIIFVETQPCQLYARLRVTRLLGQFLTHLFSDLHMAHRTDSLLSWLSQSSCEHHKEPPSGARTDMSKQSGAESSLVMSGSHQSGYAAYVQVCAS